MADDGNMFKTFKEHKHPVRCIAWSPDSNLMCSTGDKQKVLGEAVVGDHPLAAVDQIGNLLEGIEAYSKG